jgi:hypothetical protein
MKTATKENLTLTIVAAAARISRDMGLTDDQDPEVHIGQLPAHMNTARVQAFYDVDTRTLHFRPTKLWAGTVAHEFAHWVQYALRGATDCSSTPVQRRDLSLSGEHYRLTQRIETVMQRWGDWQQIHDLTENN